MLERIKSFASLAIRFEFNEIMIASIANIIEKILKIFFEKNLNIINFIIFHNFNQ